MKAKTFIVVLTLLLGSAMLSSCIADHNPVHVLNSSQQQTLENMDVHKPFSKEGLEWFQPTPFIETHWDLVMDSTQSWLQLIPRAAGGRMFKLLFIFPSITSSFDRGVSVVLSVFADNNIDVQAAIVLADDTEPALQEAAMRAALSRAEAEDFDLVYAVGSLSTAVLYKIYSGGALPWVSVLSKDPVVLGQAESYDQGSGSNMAFTSVSVPVGVQMLYLLQAMPEMKNIIMVYDVTNTSTVDTQVIPLKEYIAEEALPIKVWDVAIQNPDQAAAEMKALVPEVFAQALANDPQRVGTIFLTPASQSIHAEYETLVNLAGETPVFSLYPHAVRSGLSSAVLAIGVSFDTNCLLAGSYGVRILQNGENPGDLPVGVITPPDIAINFAKARQLGIIIPFSFFESATQVIGPDGQEVR